MVVSGMFVAVVALCAVAIAVAWRRVAGLRRRLIVGAIAGIMVAAAIVAFWPRAGTGGPRTSRPRNRLASPADLAKSFRALADGERESPRDSWDPDYVVDMVGRDPRQLFEWVRDNTYWIPYRGVLRGPVGVLMDRQGNSLDRAVLLATLLEKAGHTVRLAHGALPAAEAEQLLPRLLADRAIALGGSAAGRAVLPAPPDVQPVARQYGLDPAVIARRVNARHETLARVASELASRVADQTERLMRAVARTDSAAWKTSYDRALGALEDHWWVETQDGGSTWTDFDVLRSRRVKPAGPATPTQELTPSETVSLADLAGTSLYHEIDVRVVTEQWSDGELSERTALKQTLRPADLIGRPIVLQFWPMSWVPDSAKRAESRGGVRQQVLEERAWAAALIVGDTLAQVTALLANGADLESGPKGGSLGGLGGAVAGALSGKSATAANSELSAVWIEYQIRVPGEQPKTGRRMVFDLIGPAARAEGKADRLVVNDAKVLERGLALTMRTELLPVNVAFSPEFVRHLAASSLLGTRELAQMVARGTGQLGSAGIDSLIDRSTAGVTPLYQLAFARFAWNRDASLVYVDQPGLLTRHVYARATADTISLVDATDIVSNDVGVSLLARDAFRVRVAQGVLDTNAESLLRVAGVVSGNAGDAFASSHDWVTRTPNDTAVAGMSSVPADIAARMRGQLSAGFAVVARNWPPDMERSPFPGWWRVDPSTGRTLGFGGNGWGEAGATTRVVSVDAAPAERVPEPPPLGENTANNTRARLQSPAFKDAMKRFGTVFFTDYFWCIAANSRQGIVMSIETSIENCLGDAFVIASMAAVMPLIGFTLEASDMARPRSPNRPPPPPPDVPPTVKNNAGRGGGGGGGGGNGRGKGGGGGGGGGGDNPPDAPAPKPPKEPCDEPAGGGGGNPPKSVADATYEYQMADLEYQDAKDAAFKATSDFVSARSRGVPESEWDGLRDRADEATDAASEASQKRNAAYKDLQDAITAQKKADGSMGPVGNGPSRPKRDPAEWVPADDAACGGSAGGDVPGKKTIVGGEGADDPGPVSKKTYKP